MRWLTDLIAAARRLTENLNRISDTVEGRLDAPPELPALPPPAGEEVAANGRPRRVVAAGKGGER